MARTSIVAKSRRTQCDRGQRQQGGVDVKAEAHQTPYVKPIASNRIREATDDETIIPDRELSNRGCTQTQPTVARPYQDVRSEADTTRSDRGNPTANQELDRTAQSMESSKSSS